MVVSVMRLLLLISLLVVISMAFPRIGKYKGIRERNKERLKETLKGVDLETRRKRLAEMRRRAARREMTDKQSREIEEQLKSIRSVQTERPNQNATGLMELNAIEGVDEYMYQGDIHLTDDQIGILDGFVSSSVSNSSSTRSKRQASLKVKTWPGNTVNYYIDGSINARKQKSIANALAYIQSRTCVKFVLNPSAPNRVKVFNGAGCFASIGMIGGEQTLSLGDGCEVIGTVAHEFTHSLGFWHTQMRSDRDDYVTIDLSKVESDQKVNFDKMKANEMKAFTPYEYGSFMHYPANAFVLQKGQLSMIPKESDFVYTMGNNLISFYDIKMINDLYGCAAKCPAASSAKCQNGGLPNPNNCAVCHCPLGYGGPMCNQRPAGCGSVLTAIENWQKLEFSFGDPTDNQNIKDDFVFCNHWIKAPAGMKVQTRITYMYNSQCEYGCPFNGIEIKTDSDKRVTSPRYCCPEFNNYIQTSNLNPTPIISYNRYYYTTFTLDYRYVPVGKKGRSDIPELPQHISPCADIHPTCALMKLEGNCTSVEAEASCARTCGFCTLPI